MDGGMLLEMLSREDEESRLYELELLEQLANRMAMAESRDILGEFEPSQYLTVLSRVLSRPVQIFPDVPVLAMRCIKVRWGAECARHSVTCEPRLPLSSFAPPSLPILDVPMRLLLV